MEYRESEHLKLALEVGGKDSLAYIGTNLLDGPETATIEFVAGMNLAIVGGAEHKDQFALAIGLEDIVQQRGRGIVGNAQFFLDFAMQGHLYVFA